MARRLEVIRNFVDDNFTLKDEEKEDEDLYGGADENKFSTI